MVKSKTGIFGPSRLLTSGHTGKRQYAAAKSDRLTGDWMPASQDINTIIRSSSPMLRARIRQLVRDFAYFSRAVTIRADFTVGDGMNFQSRVINPDWQPGSKDKKFDRKICQSIEDAVAWAMEEMDAAGRQHFGELERLSNMQDSECGEYLFIKTLVKDPNRYIPYALIPVEPDWLSSDYSQVAKGNETDQGIEFDPATGRAVAYHFAIPSGFGPFSLNISSRVIRIPAADVIHRFNTKRPGQLRGVSEFVTAVLLAHDLNDYMDATIDTAKLAAKYLAMVETTDAGRFQRSRTTDGAGADTGKKIESLENAIIEYLRPGESIKFAKTDPVSGTFDPFMKFVLHMFAVATNTPHSLLTGDYADLAYTTMRGERQDYFKSMQPQQTRHIRGLTAPVINDVIYWAVFSGKLDLPGYWKNPRIYQRGVFIPPGGEPIDPLRESKANRDDMAAGLRSPQEIALRRGRDIEEILDELAEFKEMCEERGLPFDAMFTGDTTLASNPAALGAAEGSGTASAGKSNRRDNLLRVVNGILEREKLMDEEI